MSEPIFIGGCGSSGTTLLRKMINAHPNIACGPEMSIFDRPKIYESDLNWLYTIWRSMDFDSLDENMIFPLRMQPSNFTYCGLHPDNNGKYYHEPNEVEKMFDQVDSVAGFFDLYFSEYARKQNKSRWAEKTPNNLFCIDQIFDWYPQAYFIVVMRDGRDVVLSLTGRRKVHPIVAIFRWLISAAAYRDLIDRNPPFLQNIIRINYEDLVLETEKTLHKICMRINEPFFNCMLDYWKIPLPEDKKESQNPAEQYATQPVFKDSVGKWKNQEQNAAVEYMMKLTMRKTLIDLGYEDWPNADK